MNKLQELEIDTKHYWETSLAFNGRTDNTITVEKAIRNINTVLNRTNSKRALAIKSNELLDSIIGINKSKKKSTKSKKESVNMPIKINGHII